MKRRLLLAVGMVLWLLTIAHCNGTWSFYVNGQKVYPPDEPATEWRVLGPDEVWREPQFQWATFPRPGSPPW